MEVIETASVAKVFNGEEKARLQKLFRDGMATLHEIEVLREGYSDTVKTFAEEFELKPGLLKKAIKLAYKNSWNQEDDDHVQLENVLDSVGMK
jgi:hypothetical protein